jgi:hypothetical protein
VRVVFGFDFCFELSGVRIAEQLCLQAKEEERANRSGFVLSRESSSGWMRMSLRCLIGTDRVPGLMASDEQKCVEIVCR